MKLVFLLLLGTLCLASSLDTYEGYKVYRLFPKSDEQKALLSTLAESGKFDFWADVNNADLPVDIMVEPEEQAMFVIAMNRAGMGVQVFIDDVQEMVKTQKVGDYKRAGMTWTAYYRLADIYSWFDDVVSANPGRASVVIGGSSYEGRQIKGLKITFGTGRKSIVLEGGIHAREWISPATLTYIINELITSVDPAFRKIANSFDWYIFPVTNPDGYEFTHTTTRLWRKTRTRYSGVCIGADPNRNWDAHWMEQGSSSLCTSETYAGPRAFSEVETDSFSKYIRSISSNMVGYLDFHSYSQLLMVPYGHSKAQLDNYAQTVPVGRKSAEALARRYGTQYKVGNIGETIYLASGGSIDWVKQEFKTPLVYVYELRDTGRYGFLLPTDQIIPNNLEIMDSLVAMFNEADKAGIITLL